MTAATPLKPRTLTGKFVTLEPLEERHHADLLKCADSDPQIWRYISIDPKEGFAGRLPWMVEQNAKGLMITHVVRRNTDKQVVGSTSYLAMSPYNSKTEVGFTWYVPGAQGGPVNPECKYLLMKNAFEANFHRVEFKTDVNNAKSRAALAKLGATEEGILRDHMWMGQGYFRSSVYFSVLAAEWPDVKAKLEQRLSTF